MKSARVELASGVSFKGMLPDWAKDATFGEVVFNTGMVGYVEAMTDPSYKGQILCFTYPLVGNYGVLDRSHWESAAVQVSGIIVSEMAPFYARTSAEKSLAAWCEEFKIPYLEGVDTRALTKVLRDQGAMPGALLSETISTPQSFPDVNLDHLVRMVSIASPVEYGSGAKTLICIDCGMKENILRHLKNYPWKIKRVPFDYDFLSEDFDAVFVSNGPGDPARCIETIEILKKVMQLKKPVFGICLGTQLMALAIGAKTYKLPFGHRSQNQPCHIEGTDRCYLTSQNHGFAVDEKTLPSGWKVTYRNLNDESVQGIAHKSLPYFSVQFHPEACPGPVEAKELFD
ncbi:MAG: carbamoyl-phosphate synthase (glutamine-hydrolyzing) small subunit, partial [Gammaproteobacteria bacterium]|nr:carbamoyl-phosphate synthase (glutamine-hydrolyzing) small subunit [Gammaproteobacteria bacterium]